MIAAPLLLGAEPAPIVSAIRYTLEIDVGGQRYRATSVVQRTAVPGWARPSELAGSNRFDERGEGLGIRLADGRALVVQTPAFLLPPDYDVADAGKVEQFAAEGKSYPVTPNQFSRRTHPADAFLFDNADAPTTAWKFDWLNPEAALGPGARIVRYDMTPTRDPPTFDLGKTLPWFVTDRRPSLTSISPDDQWLGFRAYRANLTKPEVRAFARPVTMESDTGQTAWLDATDTFAFPSTSWDDFLNNQTPIGLRYSDDLQRITLLPDQPGVPPTTYVQGSRIRKRWPGNPYPFWTPFVCVMPAGCANILGRGPQGMPAGALIDPASGVVYLVDEDHFATASIMFQDDGR